MSTEITQTVINLIERREQGRKSLVKLWHVWDLICPRCGKKGRLLQKTTVSKTKYKYKKWYVYHSTYPNPKKPKNRKQIWCYLNKDQLIKRKVMEKIRLIELYPDLLRTIEEDIAKEFFIVCSKCKKEIPISQTWYYSKGERVFLLCESPHRIVSGRFSIPIK